MIPLKIKYHLAWFFIVVLKSKDAYWLVMYKIKLRKKGYIDADINPKTAAINKAVVDGLRDHLAEIKARRAKK